MRLKQRTDGRLSGSCIQIAYKDLFHNLTLTSFKCTG
jgi:hypothetical protein